MNKIVVVLKELQVIVIISKIYSISVTTKRDNLKN